MFPQHFFRSLLIILVLGHANAFSAAQALPTQPSQLFENNHNHHARADGLQTTPNILLPDTFAEHVKACAACHGKYGEGTDNDYFPRLAGKPAEYLFNQLKHFRDGQRQYTPMNYLVTYLSDDYLRKMADYFSSQQPPYPPPEQANMSLALIKRGQQLVLNGDPKKGVPACVACHSKTLTGMQPAIPGLIGLHSDYIRAQLGAWRTGTRHAAKPDCMQLIAVRLNDSDIHAVAKWLSMQPAPRDPAPAPARSMKLPLSCGSEAQ